MGLLIRRNPSLLTSDNIISTITDRNIAYQMETLAT